MAVENGRIFTFQGLVTLNLTLDWVILHTVVHHSLNCIYMPNFIEIKDAIWGRTDVCTHGWIFETGFIRLTVTKSRPKNSVLHTNVKCQLVK